MATAFTAYLLHVEVGGKVSSPGTKRTMVVPAGAHIEALGPALVDAFSLRGRGARFSVMSSIGAHEEATFEASGKDFDAEVAMADDACEEKPTELDTDSTTASSGDLPSPHEPVADVEADVAGLEVGEKVFSDAANSLPVHTTPLPLPPGVMQMPAGAVFAPVPAGPAPLPENGTTMMYGLEFVDGRFHWLLLEPHLPSTLKIVRYSGKPSHTPLPTPDHAPIVL